jgi:6-phosphogluconolactonase
MRFVALARRYRRWARLVVMAAPLAVAGCGNFWENPNTNNGSGSCTTDCPTTASGNFYIANEKALQVAGYNIASGGTLNALSDSPYTIATAPVAIALAPSGSFLYVSTAAGIYAYSVDSTTGALTLDGSVEPFDTADLALTMQVDPSGSWLVWAGTNSSEGSTVIGALSLDTTTGLEGTAKEQLFPIPSTTSPQLAIAPDEGNVLIALGTSGTRVYTFSEANGFGTTYASVDVHNTGGSALSVAVDPNSLVYYVGETLGDASGTEGLLRMFNYASLPTVSEVKGSPFNSGGLAPHAILSIQLDSSTFTYVANWAEGGASAGNVAWFTLETSGTSSAPTYSLTADSSVSVGTNPVGMAEDSSDTYFLVVSSGGSPDLSAFSFDSTTAGKLDSVLTASTGTDPVDAIGIAAAQ